MPAMTCSVSQVHSGQLWGSGCSGSFSNGVSVSVGSLGLSIGSIPYLGAEVRLTTRFLTGMLCASDQKKFSKCRLGQSIYITAAVYAFGMGKEYVVQVEPFRSPACGYQQFGFGNLAMGYVGTGWDASDGFSYNMYETSFCRCI